MYVHRGRIAGAIYPEGFLALANAKCKQKKLSMRQQLRNQKKKKLSHLARTTKANVCKVNRYFIDRSTVFDYVINYL